MRIAIIIAAIVAIAGSVRYSSAEGKSIPSEEDLARAQGERIEAADIIVVGSLSEIQTKRFEVTFWGTDGRSQVNSFDSGVVHIDDVIKGKVSDTTIMVAFRSKGPGIFYLGRALGKKRIWLLQKAQEPVGAFHLLTGPSLSVDDKSRLFKKTHHKAN
jgi:hypothetical protein